MVNPWRKYKKASKRKKQALHSLFAGLAFFLILYVVTKFVQIPLCPIKNIFGIRCFGCGLTRGFIEILNLNFKEATQHHILSIPIFIGISVHSFLCFSDILLERNDIEKLSKMFKQKYYLIFSIVILILSTITNNIL